MNTHMLFLFSTPLKFLVVSLPWLFVVHALVSNYFDVMVVVSP